MTFAKRKWGRVDATMRVCVHGREEGGGLIRFRCCIPWGTIPDSQYIREYGRGGAVSRNSLQVQTQSDWFNSSGGKLEGQSYQKSTARTTSQITSFAQISHTENATSNNLQFSSHSRTTYLIIHSIIRWRYTQLPSKPVSWCNPPCCSPLHSRLASPSSIPRLWGCSSATHCHSHSPHQLPLLLQSRKISQQNSISVGMRWLQRKYSLTSLELTYPTVCKCARHGHSRSLPIPTSWLKLQHTGGSGRRMQRTCTRVKWNNHW